MNSANVCPPSLSCSTQLAPDARNPPSFTRLTRPEAQWMTIAGSCLCAWTPSASSSDPATSRTVAAQSLPRAGAEFRERGLALGLGYRGRFGQFRSCCAGVCRGLRRVRSSPSAEEQQHRAGTDGCHPGPGRDIDGLFLLELDLCNSQIRFVGFPGVAEAAVDQAENAQDDQHDAENSEAAHRFSGLVIDAALLQRAKPCTLEAPPSTAEARSSIGSFLVRVFPRCLPADHLPPASRFTNVPLLRK